MEAMAQAITDAMQTARSETAPWVSDLQGEAGMGAPRGYPPGNSGAALLDGAAEQRRPAKPARHLHPKRQRSILPNQK
jgi:hypothetical protein